MAQPKKANPQKNSVKHTQQRVGGEIVDDDKVKQIATVLQGLKYHEWSRICVAVEKSFSSKKARLELANLDELENLIKLEF